MKLMKCLLIHLTAITLLWSTPKTQFSGSNTFYLESLPINESLQALRQTAQTIAGPMGPMQLQTLGQRMKRNLGFNLLDEQELEKLGIDASRAFAMAGSTFSSPENTNQNIEPIVVAAIPANDAKKFIDNLKQLIELQSQNPNNQSSLNDLGNGIYELKSNPNDTSPVYLQATAGSKWIFFSDKESNFESHLTKDPQLSIVNNGPLQKLFNNPEVMKDYKQEFFNLYISTELLSDAASLSMFMPDMDNGDTAKKMDKEIEENMDGFIGSLIFNSSEIGIRTGYIVKPEYIQNKNSLVRRVLTGSTVPLTTDKTSAGKTIAYGLFQIQLQKIIELAKTSSEEIRLEFEKFEKEFEENLSAKFTEEFLPSISGNFGAALYNIPPEQLLYNPEEYEAFFTLGIQGEGQQVFNKILNRAKSELESDPDSSVTMTDAKGGSLWHFRLPKSKNKKPLPQENDPNAATMPPMPVEKFDLIILVKEKEVIFTTSKENLDKLNKFKDVLFFNQFSQKAYSDVIFYGYVNLKEIRDYVNQSSFGMLAGPYMMFVQSLNALHWESGFQEYAIDTKVSIRLSNRPAM